jgi:ethanolamine utilization protein EutQ
MAKRIITEADIREAAASTKRIDAPAGECIVTDQARDRALELGVDIREGASPQSSTPDLSPAAAQASACAPDAKAGVQALREQSLDQLVRQACAALKDRLPAGSDAARVETLVREAVAARLDTAQAEAPRHPGASRTPDGVVFIESRLALKPGAGGVPAGDKAVLAEVLGAPGVSPLAAGYLSWERASFRREVEAPELCIVIEGELELTVGGQTLAAKPGDMVFLPRGARAVYSAPAKVVLACVNGPATGPASGQGA